MIKTDINFLHLRIEIAPRVYEKWWSLDLQVVFSLKSVNEEPLKKFSQKFYVLN